MRYIYTATNKSNDMIYVGATTKNIEDRKSNHIYRANTGTGSNFQNDIATYGVESFVWEEIDTARSVNELAEKEANYINQFKSQMKIYNQDRGGGFRKTIYQYSIMGDYINRYSSLSEAGDSVGVCKQAIGRACLNEKSKSKGFYWSYRFRKNKTPNKDKRCKRVYQFTLNYEFVNSFSSVVEAAESCGISKSGIYRVCNGKQSCFQRFIWEY